MRPNFKTIHVIIWTTVLVLGALFASGSAGEPKQYEMQNVGGRSNQCTCTQRLER